VLTSTAFFDEDVSGWSFAAANLHPNPLKPQTETLPQRPAEPRFRPTSKQRASNEQARPQTIMTKIAKV
jgi:hypothetical protein